MSWHCLILASSTEWAIPNRAIDALSNCPFNPSCDDSFSEREANSEEFEVISYSSVCEPVDLCLNSIKIPEDLKQEVQNISCAIMEEEDTNENKIVSSLNAVSTLNMLHQNKWLRSIRRIQLLSWYTI